MAYTDFSLQIDSMKYMRTGRASTSACLTAILLLHMACRPRSISRSRGISTCFSTERNLMPYGVKGKSFLIVRWRTSQKRKASQQSRKTCSIVSGFLHKKQSTPHGTLIFFPSSQVLTGSVLVCNWKTKCFNRRGNGHLFNSR